MRRRDQDTAQTVHWGCAGAPRCFPANLMREGIARIACCALPASVLSMHARRALKRSKLLYGL
eukprot:3703599-Pleurochrysis_carterae.AAC.1